jgi:transcriptional regulator with XRE-family HTH domain
MNRTANRGRGRERVTRTAFGGKLRALRRAKGLTQWDLSVKVGVHPTYIGKLETTCGRGPSRSLILRLAQALDGDRDELLHLAGKGDAEMDELKRMLRDAQEELKRERARADRLEGLLEEKVS